MMNGNEQVMMVGLKQRHRMARDVWTSLAGSKVEVVNLGMGKIVDVDRYALMDRRINTVLVYGELRILLVIRWL